MPSTPLRALPASIVDGVRVVGHGDSEWNDGSEDRIFNILRAVEDRSVFSEDLGAYETDWETTYHFSPARANIVRGLSIPADAVVLEVGAGCGAVTRYLGETAQVVDALEPNIRRARSAALRCADPPGVAVHSGPVTVIPEEPVYDLVVVVGVLEYVGGRNGVDERVRWLARLSRCLKPGGAIVCAIENRLGVQYLAGSPEEHLGRSFAGIEDYPEEGPVRTFDRMALDRVFTRAGLASEFLHVMPDYKFARMVFADRLLTGAGAPVAWRAPVFPSAGTPHRRPALASEEHLWRGLVRAGIGEHFANSFLVVAVREGDQRQRLWPAARHAAFWSVDRPARFATETTVEAAGDASLVVTKARLEPAASPEAGPLSLVLPPPEPYVAGVPTLELLEESDHEGRKELLAAWRSFVEAQAGDGPVDIDLGPQHLLVGADGEKRAIDAEWRHASATPADVVARGVLSTGIALGRRCPPSVWPPHVRTVGDVVQYLAGLAGIVVGERTIELEAELLAAMKRLPPPEGAGPPGWRAALEAVLACPTSASVLGLRDIAIGGQLELNRVAEIADRLHHTVDGLHAEVAARDARIAELELRLCDRGPVTP